MQGAGCFVSGLPRAAFSQRLSHDLDDSDRAFLHQKSNQFDIISRPDKIHVRKEAAHGAKGCLCGILVRKYVFVFSVYEFEAGTSSSRGKDGEAIVFQKYVSVRLRPRQQEEVGGNGGRSREAFGHSGAKHFTPVEPEHSSFSSQIGKSSPDIPAATQRPKRSAA